MMGDDLQSKDLFKRHFKTLEGRYELLYEKSYPSALLPTHPQARQVSRVTLAELKEGGPEHSIPTTTPTITATVGGGVRSLASRLLGAASYCKAGDVSGTSRPSSVDGPSSSNLAAGSAFDGKGSFLVFNVDDALFISDLNSPSKYPIKLIVFSIGFPVCHAFDPEATDGHDLVIGMSNGDMFTVSLREQLQNAAKKLVGAYRYIRSCSYIESRCCNVAWAPKSHGTFVVSHRDGNLYVYDKNKDGAPDPFLPMIKDKTLFSVSANSKTNPVARWHICDKMIYDVAFSNDGAYMATVGADRYLRVFDFAKQELLWHDKSCVLICCSWSADGKYILAGGDDDNVHVWSMDLQQLLAWGQGHKGWVMGVAFDPFWLPPSSENARQDVTYRFGSVCMNGNLLFWDLTPGDIAILQPSHQPIDGSHGNHSFRGGGYNIDRSATVGES
ncbi:hypothetical protein Droror1_Dr00013899 [Drosera rotundifolia]